MTFRKTMFVVVVCVLTPLFLAVALVVAVLARLCVGGSMPRLVWGSTPLINNRYWSMAMQQVGFDSETFTDGYFESINSRADWGRMLNEEFRLLPSKARPFAAFLLGLWRYDVFFLSSDGFFIGRLPWVWRYQAQLLKLAGKRIVFIPYGSDSYVYRRVRSSMLMHGLIASYPLFSRQQDEIAARLDYWCKHADVCIPATMGMDGFGRWDVAMPSVLSLDLQQWSRSTRQSDADGQNGVVVLCHAPNHRSLKGTEFVIAAFEQIKAEGLKVEMRLLEKMQNTEVRRVLREEVDILIEQLVFLGHGLNGLEGMASGMPVISNLEDDTYVMPFRRWSYFGECPIASATPENLVDVLRKLVTRPELRRQLGDAGRAYVEKYHGLDSAAHLFSEVVEYIYGRRDTLINMYHPLLGEYTKRLPKIAHPLVNTRIVD